MPIYEYRCADCGFQNEYLQKVSEPPMTLCASVFDRPSGWYATDFKNSGKGASKSTPAEGAKPEGGKPEGGKPEGAGGGESKSESKSEAPSDKGAASSCAAG